MAKVLFELDRVKQDKKTIKALSLSRADMPLSLSDGSRVRKVHNLMHQVSEITGQTLEELFDKGGLQKIINDYAGQNDGENSLRLIDVIKKTNHFIEGIFANINSDLNEHISTDSPPIILMAYAYARRTVAAGLFLQGVFSREDYAQSSKKFKTFQMATGHSVEFQEEAAEQAYELLGSYDPRLNKEMIVLITSLVERNQTPEHHDGKNHVPYDLIMANLQRVVKK